MKGKKGKLFNGGPDLLRYSSIGLEMGVAIGIGLLIGIYLDRWLETSPWMTLIFFFLGVAAGFKNIIRLILEESKKKDRDGQE